MSEPLGEVMIRLGLDNSKFGSELSRSQKLVKYATSQMKANFSALGAGGNKVAALTQKQRDLNQVIVAQQERVKALEKAYKGSFDQNGKAGRSTAKLATQLQNAKAKLGGYQHQLVVTAQAAAKARVETTGLTGTMNRLGKGATQAGQKMSSVGGKMTTRFTVPVVAGLTAAVKAAVDFDSQISEMGPLLTDGGKVTKEYRLQLDKLAESSKKWAGQYGISTSVINDAMSELIKRGFTAQQTLGSMPSILDATKASGEDLGIVMQATASIMEQFGLKGKTTEETLKNTQRVTDSLTYAANATAAGFGDMSDAMAYVGPVAKSLKLSVEDTAAAIGVLSDQGIEGQKAGTNLRGILTSLVNVTPAAKEQFAKMGISAKQAGEDASDLPKLIDDITKGTKGWTAQAKAKALATIFGRQNQAAMNALIAAGSDELRTLTKETESAGGATKKVADQMNETKANQVKRMVENIKQMGITIGQKLLPLLPPVLNNINNLVDAFNKLDKGTQNNIVKWVALTAAMGPALKIGGSALQLIGGANTGIVQLASKLAQWRAKQAVLNSTVAAGTDATGAFTTGLAGAGAKTGMLTKLLSPAGLAIAGVGTALVVGKVAWDKWGQAAYDSGQRSRRWGSDVGKAANDSLQRIKNASTQASDSLEGFGKNGKQSAKGVQDAFKQMYKTISGDNKAVIDKSKKLYESMPKSAQAAYKKTMQAQTKAAEQRTKQAKEINQSVDSIVAASVKSGKDLTDDQKIVLDNYVRQMQKVSIDSLDISAKRRKQIMQALNGDYVKMNQNDLSAVAGHFETMSMANSKAFKKSQKQLKAQYDNNKISKKAYQKTMTALEKDYMVKNGQIMEARIAADQRAGMSSKATWAAMSRETGLSVKKLQKLYDGWSESATKNTVIASKATNKAGRDWNKLVLDPKTGKVKTNAQEEITKAAKSKKGWDKLKFALKKAKLTTNAKTMVAKAALQSDKWDTLSWKDKKALIKTNAGKIAIKTLESKGVWDKLTYDQKEAIVTSNSKKAVAQAMVDSKQWSKLNWQDQKALVQTNLGATISQSLQLGRVWDDLTLEQQQAIITSNSKDVVKDAVFASGKWNTLPWHEQLALVKTNSAKVAAQALEDEKLWNKLNFAQQEAILSANTKQEVAQAVFDSGKWNDLPWDKQDALVVTNAGKTAMDAMIANDTWKDLSFDQQKAVVTSNSKEEIAQAIFDSGQWNKLYFKAKKAVAKNEASKEIMDALHDAGEWNDLDVKTQKAIVQSDGLPQLTDAILKMGNWNELPSEMKDLLVNDDDARHKLIQAGVDIKDYDTKKPLPKELTANAEDLDKVLIDSGLKIDVLDGKKPEKKYLNANNQNFIDKVTQSDELIKGYNLMDPDLKQLLAENGDIVGKLNTSEETLKSYNALDPQMKQLIADTYGFDSKIDESTGKVVFFDNKNPKTKQLKANNSDANKKLKDSDLLLNKYTGNNPPSKALKGHDAGLKGALGTGIVDLAKFKRDNPPSKKLKAHDAGLHSTTAIGKNRIQSYNSVNPTTKKLKARDKASGPAKVATNGVAAFRRQKDHTVTLTTVVNRVTKWVSKKITGHQKGTNDFGGGLAMINDQPGPRFRELIQYPNGQLSVFHGRNVVVPDFPRHTKIYPANITAKLLPGLKQYASGKNVPANAEIVDMTRNLNETTNQEVQVTRSSTVSLNDETLERMAAAIAKRLPQSDAPVNLMLDGKTVGQIIGPIINNQNGRNINLSARGVTT